MNIQTPTGEMEVITEKRDFQVKSTYNPKEKAKLLDQARRAGYESLGPFVRDVSLGLEIKGVTIVPEANRKAAKNIKSIGVGINDIVARLHKVDADNAHLMEETIRFLEVQIQLIYRQLRGEK